MEILDTRKGNRRGKEAQLELRKTQQNSENARPQHVHTIDAIRLGDRKSLEHRAPRKILLSFNLGKEDEARDAGLSLFPEALLDPAGGRHRL